MSFDNDNENLLFNWSQVYGPTIIDFVDNSSISTDISNLEEGVYKIKLTVSDGYYSSNDFLFVFVSATSNLAPTVVLESPNSNSSFYYGSTIPLIASASDIDGEIILVEFFNFENKIGEDKYLSISI